MGLSRRRRSERMGRRSRRCRAVGAACCARACVSTDADTTPLASFEAKWSEAYPEFALAQRFVRDDREAKLAFACLVFEIEHAAFGIREAQPAAIKLQWWAEELMRAGKGEARHPLTQALGARIAASVVSP